MKFFCILALVAVLTGCVTNPYKDFYKENPNVAGFDSKYKPVIKADSDPTNNPRVDLVGNLQKRAEELMEESYIPIGYSSFYSPNVSESLAATQGKTIGAEIIIVSKNEKDRVAENIPTIIPVFTSVSTSYGKATSSSFVGSSTTVGVDRFYYQSVYFFKYKKPAIFGTLVRDLSADERKELASNKGVRVVVVVKNTPAYAADFFKDDILLKIGDYDLSSKADYTNAIENYRGAKVYVQVKRKGVILNKEVQMSNDI